MMVLGPLELPKEALWIVHVSGVAWALSSQVVGLNSI